MSQFYCRENDLILFHTSSSSLPKLPDQSTALLYLRLLRHSFVILKSADVFFLNVLLQFYLLLFLDCVKLMTDFSYIFFILNTIFIMHALFFSISAH